MSAPPEIISTMPETISTAQKRDLRCQKRDHHGQKLFLCLRNQICPHLGNLPNPQLAPFVTFV